MKANRFKQRLKPTIRCGIAGNRLNTYEATLEGALEVEDGHVRFLRDTAS